jgi:transposase
VLTLALPTRVFLCTEPADMRKSFDGLAALVEAHLGSDPLSGDLFVFRGKRGDRVKLLYWLGDGYAIWYRRLEEGTFVFPTFSNSSYPRVGPLGLSISAKDLALLLDGIDLASVKRRHRYRRPTSPDAKAS